MRLLLLALLLAGCGPHVAFLPRVEGARYTASDHVEVLFAPPTRPFEEIGLLTVEKRKGSEEALLKRLRQRAQQVGADAVLMGHPTARTTGGAAVAWLPGLVTASHDETRRLEGLAIRWLEAAAATAPRGDTGRSPEPAPAYGGLHDTSLP